MSTLTDPLDPHRAPAASDPAVFGGVEAGGTTWVCAKGKAQATSRRVEVIPTTTPPETLGRVVEFFKRDSVRVAALGVGSFGFHRFASRIGDLRLITKALGDQAVNAGPGSGRVP